MHSEHTVVTGVNPYMTSRQEGKGEGVETEVTWGTEPMEQAAAVLCPGNSRPAVQRRMGHQNNSGQTLARKISQITVVAPGTLHPDGSVSFHSHKPLLSYRSSQLLIPCPPSQMERLLFMTYDPHTHTQLMMWDQSSLICSLSSDSWGLLLLCSPEALLASHNAAKRPHRTHSRKCLHGVLGGWEE